VLREGYRDGRRLRKFPSWRKMDELSSRRARVERTGRAGGGGGDEEEATALVEEEALVAGLDSGARVLSRGCRQVRDVSYTSLYASAQV
jgi:hypothetical protein